VESGIALRGLQAIEIAQNRQRNPRKSLDEKGENLHGLDKKLGKAWPLSPLPRLPACLRVSQLQRGGKFGFAERLQPPDRPSSRPPGVRQRGKRVRADNRLQRLFVGREFEIRAQPVGRQRHEGHPRLEGAAVEMRIFLDAGQRERETAKVVRIGQSYNRTG